MSRTTTPSLLLLALPVLLSLLVGCQGPETGLDKSIVTGVITIPPVAVAEIEDAADADNDDPLAPQYVGADGSAALSYRAVIVDGTVGEFGSLPQGGGPREPDAYGFSPLIDGDFTFWLQYETDASTEGRDYTETVVLHVEVYDLDAGGVSVFSEPTDGSGGAWSGTVPVTGGVEYAVMVWGEYGEVVETAPYTLIISGSTPGPESILVGAYLEGDPAVASAPVGGTTVPEWAFDEDTWTWGGAYEALFMRSVVNAEQTSDDPGAALANPTIDEAVSKVYMMAGTLSSLNKSPSAGSLYTTASVEVTLNGESVQVPEPLVLDGIFPKVPGVQVAETLPDTTFAELDGNYNLVLDTLVAQEGGALTGPGFVDSVDGTMSLTGGDGWEVNDSDAYQFTVTEAGYASITAAFDDPSATADLDFMFYGDDGSGTYIDYMYFDCASVVNPELGTLYIPTAPDMTYYLLALGYSGSGDIPYHIEIEWTAP